MAIDHGGGSKAGKAGTAPLPSVGALAAVRLVVIEGGHVAWVLKGGLAASYTPRHSVIGVPLGGGGGGVGKINLARARDLTAILTVAACQLGFVAGRVAVGLRCIRHRSTTWHSWNATLRGFWDRTRMQGAHASRPGRNRHR